MVRLVPEKWGRIDSAYELVCLLRPEADIENVKVVESLQSPAVVVVVTVAVVAVSAVPGCKLY